MDALIDRYIDTYIDRLHPYILHIIDTVHQSLMYDLIKFFVRFECSLLLTAVEVAFSQLDDGVIFVQHTTSVYSLSMAGLQHLHSEGVWTLGQFASILYVCTWLKVRPWQESVELCLHHTVSRLSCSSSSASTPPHRLLHTAM